MPKGVYKRTQSVWNKNKKGVMPIPWNKGLKSFVKPWLGKKRDSDTKNKISKKLKEYYKINGHPLKNRKATKKQIEHLTLIGRKSGLKRIGLPLSYITKNKISIANKGKKLSKEHIEIIRNVHLGTKASDETKLKMSLSQKGKKRIWDKEVKRKFAEKQRKRLLGRKMSDSEKLNHSNGAKKAGCGKWMKGRKLPKETIEKIIKNGHPIRGEKHKWWKGGITPERIKIYKSPEYRDWRKKVFERDKYKCQCCGKNSSENEKIILNAHHLNPFSLHIDERFDIENGLTLCKSCHRKVDTINNKRTNNFTLKNNNYLSKEEIICHTVNL